MTEHDTHIGRAWSDTELEDSCPCPKASCGLVLAEAADPACTQHPPERAKTIRQRHTADRCPGPRTPELDKMAKAKARTHPVGEFIDWLGEQGIVLAAADECGELYPLYGSTESLLADWCGIDLTKIDQEKRSLLKWVRERTP